MAGPDYVASSCYATSTNLGGETKPGPVAIEQLWVAGRFVAVTDKGVVWEFQGVFRTREGALAACVTDDYFIAPATLGNLISHETTDWPDLIYPLRQEASV